MPSIDERSRHWFMDFYKFERHLKECSRAMTRDRFVYPAKVTDWYSKKNKKTLQGCQKQLPDSIPVQVVTQTLKQDQK
jgi:hypothetical protein